MKQPLKQYFLGIKLEYVLKGLYRYTLIIGHKSCNMLSMLNKFTLNKELQTLVRNNVSLDKKHKHNKTNDQT